MLPDALAHMWVGTIEECDNEAFRRQHLNVLRMVEINGKEKLRLGSAGHYESWYFVTAEALVDWDHRDDGDQDWSSLGLRHCLVTNECLDGQDPELHVASTIEFLTSRINPLVPGIRDMLCYTRYWSVDTVYRAVQHGYPEDETTPRRTPFNRELSSILKGRLGTPHPVRTNMSSVPQGDPVGKDVLQVLKNGKTVQVRPRNRKGG